MSTDMEVIAAAEHQQFVDDHPLPLKDLVMATLRILIPTDISNMLWMSSQTITLVYVSRAHGVAGAGQYGAGITLFNMLGFSFVQGFGAAIDTLSSQAFGKNRKSPEVGETLQLALAFNLALGVLISIFFLNCESFVVFLLGEESGVGTAEFLRWCPPYLAVQIISGVMSKTMFAQKEPGVVAVANFAAALTSPVAGYFLVPLGLYGAALSLTITVGLCAVTHILCCLYHPRVIVREAQWPTPKLRSMDAWRRFFKVAIPSVVATCAEWWAFEFQVVLAARLGPVALGIHSVCMNLVGMLLSIALGICVSASVVVGNALGAMKPVQAKQYAYFIVICDVLIGAVTAFFMLLFGRDVARVFASKESPDYHVIVTGVHDMMLFVVLCHVGDSVQYCLQGVFRGAGRPKEAGIAVLATLWLIGVPASALYVIVLKVGVAGCIGGLLTGFLFEIPVLVYLMTRFNWERLALKSQEQSPDVELVVIEDDSGASNGTDGSSEDEDRKKAPPSAGRSSDDMEWKESEMERPNSLCNESLTGAVDGRPVTHTYH